jgi:hypothetical protein
VHQNTTQTLLPWVPAASLAGHNTEPFFLSHPHEHLILHFLFYLLPFSPGLGKVYVLFGRVRGQEASLSLWYSSTSTVYTFFFCLEIIYIAKNRQFSLLSECFLFAVAMTQNV